MTEEIKAQLEQAGVDVRGTLGRFLNNENLYERLLKKFLEDPNFQGMLDAISSGDVESAFVCAHTLKGVGGNLGLNGLTNLVNPLVETFRKGDMLLSQDQVNQLKTEYDKLCSLIQHM